MEAKAIELFTRFITEDHLYRTSDGEYFLGTELSDCQAYIANVLGGGAYMIVNRETPLPPSPTPLDENVPIWVYVATPAIAGGLRYDGVVSSTNDTVGTMGNVAHTTNNIGAFRVNNYVMATVRSGANVGMTKYGKIVAIAANVITINWLSFTGTANAQAADWEISLSGAPGGQGIPGPIGPVGNVLVKAYNHNLPRYAGQIYKTTEGGLYLCKNDLPALANNQAAMHPFYDLDNFEFIKDVRLRQDAKKVLFLGENATGVPIEIDIMQDTEVFLSTDATLLQPGNVNPYILHIDDNDGKVQFLSFKLIGNVTKANLGNMALPQIKQLGSPYDVVTTTGQPINSEMPITYFYSKKELLILKNSGSMYEVAESEPDEHLATNAGFNFGTARTQIVEGNGNSTINIGAMKATLLPNAIYTIVNAKPNTGNTVTVQFGEIPQNYQTLQNFVIKRGDGSTSISPENSEFKNSLKFILNEANKFIVF
jgi:hypothetical protein